MILVIALMQKAPAHYNMYYTCRIMILVGLFHLSSLFGQQEGNRLAVLFSDTNIFQCVRIGINTAASDFGVVKYKSGYVFSSSRDEHVGVEYYAEDTLSPLLDLYYFEKKDSSRFSKPKPFDKSLNTKSNDGPATFSDDGKKVICTKNNSSQQNSDRSNELLLTLISSEYANGKWRNSEVLPFCQAGFNYTDPAFGSNDSILFFASDCNGGFGGMDIYYSKLSTAGWGKPVNLGAKVNSFYNEVFPFYSAAGNLYFSSNRPGGKGGLDIYAWTLSDSVFMFPQLLGQPVNSETDDFAFSCSADETEGFFSSNRNNKITDDDIYYFRLNWPQSASYDTLKKPKLCYEFFEDATMNSADTVSMKYSWSFSDGTKENGLKVKKCFDTTGTYQIHLDIRDSSTGEMILSSVDYDLEIAPPNPITVFIPDTFHLHESLTINSQKAMLKGYSVSSVYYDFGCGYKCEGISASHIYNQPGIYYPKIFFKLKNQNTGAEEYRCLVQKITVL
jgi:hypothetical protein